MDEESSQVFVPFVSEVRVSSDGLNAHALSIELDDTSIDKGEIVVGSPSQTSSAGGASAMLGSDKRHTPPSSPHFSKDR